MTSLSFRMKFCTRMALNAFLWWLVVPQDITAQVVTVMNGEPQCAGCQIVMDTMVVLDGRRSEYVGDPMVFARMSDGRSLLTTGFDMARIHVFDRHGRYLRSVGREGEGPGEYKGIAQIKVGPGDTIRVYDQWNPRVTLLTPDLEYIDSRPMAAPVGFGAGGLYELPDGRLVTQRSLPLDGHAGYPLHLMNQDGAILLSFGAENPTFRRDEQHLLWRTMTPADEDQLWVASLNRFAIELWDLNGQRRLELQRDESWFQTHTRFGMDYDQPGHPPNPGIVGLRLDENGLLWVLLNVPDEDWRSGVGPVQGMAGEPMTGVADPDRYFDSIVEVIDPRRRHVVTTQRFDTRLDMLMPDGTAVSYRENDVGFPFVHVHTLRLTHDER